MVTAELSTNGTGTHAPTTIRVTVAPLNMAQLQVRIRGTAPYVQHAFGQKARTKIRDKQLAGSTANSRSRTAREARDFQADFDAAQHIAEDGWYGIPATAFRLAAIDACRVAGVKMTLAKMSLTIRHDGLDKVDGQGLVRLYGGEPELSEMMATVANGAPDIRIRAMWRQWEAVLRVDYDADQFTASDVYNLLRRAGAQVGVGEGRPFSKNSAGMGWGTFELVGDEESRQ